MSLIDANPATFMSMSNSANKLFKTCLTPLSPSMDKPLKFGRYTEEISSYIPYIRTTDENCVGAQGEGFEYVRAFSVSLKFEKWRETHPYVFQSQRGLSCAFRLLRLSLEAFPSCRQPRLPVFLHGLSPQCLK